MKRAWMLGAATAILFSMGCQGQKGDLPADFSGDLQAVADGKADTISPKKLKVVGSLDYGQSATVKYDGSSKYLAYKFGGHKGDKVVIDVKSSDGDAYAWLTNDAGKVLSKDDDSGYGTNAKISATLTANKNPDIITYYIVFKEYFGHAAKFTVSLQGPPPAADYFSCKTDSDCVAVSKGGCCPNGYNVAVNVDEADAYTASVACTTVPHPICPLYVVNDTRVAECNNGSHQCEMVEISAIQCGGFIANAHHCPNGYDCAGAPNPDLPGSCVEQPKTCGGIANLPCPDGQHCIDNPNDNCDPNNGGADCGGICVTCTDNVDCLQGSHWDATQCACVPDSQTCGGIANIQCPAGQKCVDNPNDNCDPNNGGADCGGICVTCIDNVACMVGSHFSQYQCKCVSDTCVDNVLCTATSHWSQDDCTCVPN